MTLAATGGLERLSLNTATCKRLDLAGCVDAAARAGLGAIGPWRDRVHEVGVERAARLIRDAGLRVSTLCRGGFLTASDDTARRNALDDNRRAIDEAATLGTRELVMVVGGLPSAFGRLGLAMTPGDAGDKDLVGARQRVADRIAELVPYAAERGVRLALEPMHPLFAADRGVLQTLEQALDLAAPFPADVVGVVADTYHVWWDPRCQEQIARAGREGRLASYQVCDWVLPLAPEPLNSRGLMGDGYIDFPTITSWVTDAGYAGDVEVEIFNEQLWALPGDEIVDRIAERYRDLVAPRLG
ncbi:MAG TPA: sugar phosphate isomerase/epimerase family protein [Propionibacteriaceae bacterium]|nr:sugar phosphate isomerase/epimerase family protein [Propionibacteriaceae bacterium]